MYRTARLRRPQRWISLLLVATVLAGTVGGTGFAAPTPVIEGTVSVDNFTDLQAALNDSTVTTITIAADISSNQQLDVTRAVALDGEGHSLTVDTDLGTDNSSKHAVNFLQSVPGTVTVSDLTIDSANLAYGAQAYVSGPVVLDNVTLANSRGAGLTVNGSDVTASGLITAGNAWGAVNVDPGSGVDEPSKFTLISGELGEPTKIWSDGANVQGPATVTVVAPEDYTKVDMGPGVAVWALPCDVNAHAVGNGTVTPSAQSVTPGTDAVVTVTADPGFYCSSLLVDDEAVVPQESYAFNVGLESHEITATFSELAPAETFDYNPTISDQPAEHTWYTDRYAPSTFAKAFFDGDYRLKLGISSEDSQTGRPSNYSGAFYNTQGRGYQIATSTVVATDIWLGTDSDANDRRMGLWAVAVDDAAAVTGYPIIEFANSPSGDEGFKGFRVWDNLGWHNLDLEPSYERWYSLRIQQNPGSVSYYIDDTCVYTSDFDTDIDMAASVGFNSLILEAYNFGESYDVYFDNVVPVPATPAPYEITTSAGVGGTITPSQGVDTGDDATVKITPNSGYYIKDVLKDGVSIGASGTVEFSNVTADHSVTASFSAKKVDQVAGDTRFSGSVAIAASNFDPDRNGSWPGVTDIVLACGDDRAAADPLSAAGLSWAYDAPLFLTSSSSTDLAVKQAIKQIAEKNGKIKVHIVGGTMSVPDARYNEIAAYVGATKLEKHRILTDGNRYDMAAAIAQIVSNEWEARGNDCPPVVLVANGADPTKFFDALALSPIAAAKGYPILLVDGSNTVPAATQAKINAIKADGGAAKVIIGGGPMTVTDAVKTKLAAERWAGATRYSTALVIADKAIGNGWLSCETSGIAAKLPDALTGGSVMGLQGGVLVLTDGAALTPETGNWFSANKASVLVVHCFGGDKSLTPTVRAAIYSRIK